MKPEGIVTLSRFIRWLRLGALFTLVVGFALTVRLTILSANHFHRAVEAESLNDYTEAIRSYSWSIRNYYPGNPYAARSLKNVLTIVDSYEKNDRFSQRNKALHDVHATLLAIRSFYQPYRIELQRIETLLQTVDNTPQEQDE